MLKISSFTFSLVLLLFLFPMRMMAFEGGLYHIHGIVVDATNGEPVPGVAIVCQYNNNGVVSNENGLFSLNISWSDSLVIMALTYENRVVKPPDSLFIKPGNYVLSLTPSQHLLGEIEVTGEERIPIALRSDVFKEKPKTMDFIFRPISVIYYYVSLRERNKRLLLRMIEQEELMAYYEHLYNSGVIAQYSGLSGRDLDYCIIYCNANIELKHGDTDDIVKWKIISVISDYYKKKTEDKEV